MAGVNAVLLPRSDLHPDVYEDKYVVRGPTVHGAARIREDRRAGPRVSDIRPPGPLPFANEGISLFALQATEREITVMPSGDVPPPDPRPVYCNGARRKEAEE